MFRVVDGYPRTIQTFSYDWLEQREYSHHPTHYRPIINSGKMRTDEMGEGRHCRETEQGRETGERQGVNANSGKLRHKIGEFSIMSVRGHQLNVELKNYS